MSDLSVSCPNVPPRPPRRQEPEATDLAAFVLSFDDFERPALGGAHVLSVPLVAAHRGSSYPDATNAGSERRSMAGHVRSVPSGALQSARLTLVHAA